MTTAAVSPRERRTERAAAIDAITTSPVALAQFVKITTPLGVLPLDLWPHQVAVLRAARIYRFLSITKARQLGVTEVLMLLDLWESIAYPFGFDLLVSLNLEEAIAAMSKVTDMYDSLPLWVQEAFPVGTRNQREFSVRHGRKVSGIIVLPSSDNAGRGRTFRRVTADERARWEHQAERIGSLRPTIADGGSLVESSTARGFDEHHATWSGGVDIDGDMDMGNGYARMFIGALARPDRDLAWVMREREILDTGDPGLGAQEYPLTAAEAFRASGRCVFDQDALQDLLDHSCRPPDSRVELRKTSATIQADPIVDGPWSVWQFPVKGRSYIIAADVCGGGGGSDFSAAAVYDAESWDQVASYHGRPEPDQFARELARAGWLWRTDKKTPALLVPESNNHGQAVVALLREWRYPRVYRVETFDQRTQRTGEQLGWLTTTKSRQQALDTLKAGVRQGSLGIRDQAAVGEMLRFIEKDGREEAESGAHDDRVLTHAIAAAVLARSRNATPPKPSAPAAPYRPRVSSRTGY